MKLNEALRKKIEGIEREREKEKAEEKKLEEMTKVQREKFKRRSLKKSRKGKTKKSKKTAIEEEREVHEAYQLILSEYHRKAKHRVFQKTKGLGLLRTGSKKSKEDTSTDIDHKFGF